MAEARDVLGRGAGAADVVDRHAAVLGQGGRVHEDDRHAGPADLLDLRMGVAQADGHDAIDGGAAHRPGEAAVEGRDEVERVAVLLGGEGDPFAEGTEERVAEDDAERLGGEDPDRHRLALGEHPCDRVRSIAELFSHVADAARRLGRQAVRAVERERHRGLADARLAGDVSDARTLGAGLHSVASPSVGRSFDTVSGAHAVGVASASSGRARIRHRPAGRASAEEVEADGPAPVAKPV
jgi:hypothetical protein